MIVPASKYLLAILNSRLADYYVRQLGVTRNGGYFEYKPMFIEKLPVPKINSDDKKLVQIETLVDCADYAAIDPIIYDIYRLTNEEINYINSL